MRAFEILSLSMWCRSYVPANGFYYEAIYYRLLPMRPPLLSTIHTLFFFNFISFHSVSAICRSYWAPVLLAESGFLTIWKIERRTTFVLNKKKRRLFNTRSYLIIHLALDFSIFILLVIGFCFLSPYVLYCEVCIHKFRQYIEEDGISAHTVLNISWTVTPFKKHDNRTLPS